MRFDRYATISFSLNLFSSNVEPYAYNWFKLADEVPLQVQAFPTKWDVAKNASKGTVKNRLFLSSSALFVALGKITAGLHTLGINWLIEVIEPDDVTASNINAYLGNMTQVNEIFFVIECNEYSGDITKIT